MTFRAPSAVLLAIVATSCGGSSGGPGTAAPPPDGARPVAVVAKALAFDPDTLTVAAGEALAVTLRSGDIAHDLTLDEPGFHVHVKGGGAGTAGLRINTPGTYTAYCSVPGHREAGMNLTIRVTG